MRNIQTADGRSWDVIEIISSSKPDEWISVAFHGNDVHRVIATGESIGDIDDQSLAQMIETSDALAEENYALWQVRPRERSLQTPATNFVPGESYLDDDTSIRVGRTVELRLVDGTGVDVDVIGQYADDVFIGRVTAADKANLERQLVKRAIAFHALHVFALTK
jgi:hypothetical protein